MCAAPIQGPKHIVIDLTDLPDDPPPVKKTEESEKKSSTIDFQKIINPADFDCPILQRRMRKPVSTPCGHTFEKKALKDWYKKNKDKFTCPVCQVPIPPHFNKDLTLKKAIQNWKQETGVVSEEMSVDESSAEEEVKNELSSEEINRKLQEISSIYTQGIEGQNVALEMLLQLQLENPQADKIPKLVQKILDRKSQFVDKALLPTPTRVMPPAPSQLNSISLPTPPTTPQRAAPPLQVPREARPPHFAVTAYATFPPASPPPRPSSFPSTPTRPPQPSTAVPFFPAAAQLPPRPPSQPPFSSFPMQPRSSMPTPHSPPIFTPAPAPRPPQASFPHAPLPPSQQPPSLVMSRPIVPPRHQAAVAPRPPSAPLPVPVPVHQPAMHLAPSESKKRKREEEAVQSSDSSHVESEEKKAEVAEQPAQKKPRLADDRVARLFDLIEEGTWRAFQAALAQGPIDAVDPNGFSLLHRAVLNKREIKFIQILVQARFPINTRGPLGDTALHSAVKGSSLSHAAELLRLGADKTLTNTDGKTPLQLVSHKATRLRRLLEE